MKKLLGIVVLGIGLLTFSAWPFEHQLINYCFMEKAGIEDKYYLLNVNNDGSYYLIEENEVFSILDEKISNNDPSLIKCQPSGDADIDEFKTKHFKKTFYGNFKQLINGNFYNLNKLKIWAY